jgi:hypothetical protein
MAGAEVKNPANRPATETPHTRLSHKPRFERGFAERPLDRRCPVARSFVRCGREQELLLPPSLREWLPEDHLAWCVLDAVDEIELSAFDNAYREDGWGRAAFEPGMMVALLLYAYAVGRALQSRDRAALPRGRRLSCDHGEPDSRSRDDRAFPRAA